MTTKERIDADLKQAMLAGDKELAMTLRGLKSAILYEEVAQKKRDSGLDDQSVIALLRKEAKKRQESAALFARGGNTGQAAKEQAELQVIQGYLPQVMTEDELSALVDEVMKAYPDAAQSKMGMIIAEIKTKSEGRADGASIARLVKERLQ